ncbi:hypothetical protein Q4E40_01050 [Pontibacter sp. BT731]|nr:hypothetical protein [Pontibacter sp. BT731]MDO6388692.1 hypothetical protein [Pontibacter sp. BT731]
MYYEKEQHATGPAVGAGLQLLPFLFHAAIPSVRVTVEATSPRQRV